MHRIEVGANVLQANDGIARLNRQSFARRGLFVVNLMSAPGAGKTSILEQTITRLKGLLRIGVIEGDLHTTYDADRIAALGIPAYQITTGTVCHLDAQMIHSAVDLDGVVPAEGRFKLDGLDLLIIENVGNMVCPAEFDLGENLRVMVYSCVEGVEKPRKYPLMFHQADVVLVNKVDLIPYSGESLEDLRANVLEINPVAPIFPVSCRTAEGISDWCDWLIERIGKPVVVGQVGS